MEGFQNTPPELPMTYDVVAYVTCGPTGREHRTGFKSEVNVRRPDLPAGNGLSHPGKKLVSLKQLRWFSGHIHVPSSLFEMRTLQLGILSFRQSGKLQQAWPENKE